MRKLQNTLFITRQGSYLHKQRETLVVDCDGEKLMQLPVHAIAHIFCFGNVLVSPFLLGFCGENRVSLAFFSEYGKYLGRLQGRQSGNVLLRRGQYQLSREAPLAIARNIIASKIQSCKRVLLRRLRHYGEQAEVKQAVIALNSSLRQLGKASSVDSLRGIEGDAAAVYFGVFTHLIRAPNGLVFERRNRRPPRDPVNAMLSFLYSVLGHEIGGALESVGLDPQVGFLHADRPGRDSLAQDLLEEFRAWWIDRLVLSMINRGQVKQKDFLVEASGAVTMKAATRKTVLTAYQTRKQEKIRHPYFGEEVEVGLLPIMQSMLLARHLRGDLAAYPSFLMR